MRRWLLVYRRRRRGRGKVWPFAEGLAHTEGNQNNFVSLNLVLPGRLIAGVVAKSVMHVHMTRRTIEDEFGSRPGAATGYGMAVGSAFLSGEEPVWETTGETPRWRHRLEAYATGMAAAAWGRDAALASQAGSLCYGAANVGFRGRMPERMPTPAGGRGVVFLRTLEERYIPPRIAGRS